MNFQELQRHIERDDALSVERQLAGESPDTASQEDLETLVRVLTDSVDTNVALEIMLWIESTGPRPCAAAFIRVLVQGSNSVESWLTSLINRLANIPAGQAALKEVLRGLAEEDLLRATGRHERLRELIRGSEEAR